MKNTKLTFKTPATCFEEGFPLGNGSIGAMILNNTGYDLIMLNHDRLWSGAARNKNNPLGSKYLQEIKNAAVLGKQAIAEKLISQYVLGENTESFLPFGNLHITFPSEPGAFSRTLDLQSSIADCSSTTTKRQFFVSYPDQVFCLQYTFKKPVDLMLKQDCKMPFSLSGTDQLIFSAMVPAIEPPAGQKNAQPVMPGMSFWSVTKAVSDGTIIYDKGIEVKQATYVVFYFSAVTAHGRGPSFDGALFCAEQIRRAVKKGFSGVYTDHVVDVRKHFDRVAIDLGGRGALSLDDAGREALSTDTDYTDLIETAFNFGRYLLLASSRPGSYPANLQGIWNDKLDPPWRSNYTMNINLEMNYWPAELTNLSECHQPLFDFIKGLAENGTQTADLVHGIRKGWVAHHNSDLYHHTSPVIGSGGTAACVYGYWPMSSGWLAGHLYEHYLFTQDLEFLRSTAYPIMKKAAEFYLEFMIKYDGVLTTAPSTSPENYFIKKGKAHSVSFGSTMDIAILRNLFSALKATCKEADDLAFLPTCDYVLENLQPYKLTPDGRLQEWVEDYKEADPAHRHLSHLFGLYPGNDISPSKTPALAAAAEKSLERRTDEGTGWSLAWKINLQARLCNAEKCLKLIKRQLKLTREKEIVMSKGGTYPNLFCAHPPFQIDGNFGLTAGIAEMLIQSHEDVIHLLPALPAAWKNGSFKGLKARGGYTVDAEWRNGELSKLYVFNRNYKRVTVRFAGREQLIDSNKQYTLTQRVLQ